MQEIQSEQESQRGSVLALVIAIVVVFVCINAEKVVDCLIMSLASITSSFIIVRFIVGYRMVVED